VGKYAQEAPSHALLIVVYQRIDPIGYDAKRNAYWLIGGMRNAVTYFYRTLILFSTADRLWIQRVLPKPPKSLKRKRPDNKGKSKAAAPKNDSNASNSRRQPAKRRRLQTTDDEVTPKATKIRGQLSSPSNGRGGRAAKTQAKAKLDAQAKELAEFQRQTASAGRSSKRLKMEPARPMGTRVSARLRGEVEDEWQPVPEEWLVDAKDNGAGPSLANGRGRKKGEAGKRVMKTGLESDGESISDLTELSSERDEENQAFDGTDVVDEEMTNEDRHISPDEGTHNNLPDDSGLEEHLPDGFIEWETVSNT
jgi:hypothetical protein